MTNFADEFRNLVAEARNYHAQALAALQLAAAEWDTASRQLLEHLRRRFKEAASGVGQHALVEDTEQSGPNRPLATVLTWRAPGPERSLVCTVEDGLLWIGWRLNHLDRVQLSALSVHDVSEAQLDDLIRCIADQKFWAGGKLPDITLPIRPGARENTHQTRTRSDTIPLSLHHHRETV